MAAFDGITDTACAPSEDGPKVCRGCLRALPLSMFGVNYGRLRPRCNECRREEERQRRLRDPDHVRALARDGRKRNAERTNLQSRERYAANKEKYRAAKRSDYQRHREKRLAQWHAGNTPEKQDKARRVARRWYAENTERGKLNAKSWRQSNPDKAAAGSARRRALKRGVNADLISLQSVCRRDGWICGLCGQRINRKLKYPDPLSASIDHIVPLSDGGQHIEKNVQCAHLKCNVRKQAGKGGQLRLF